MVSCFPFMGQMNKLLKLSAVSSPMTSGLDALLWFANAAQLFSSIRSAGLFSNQKHQNLNVIHA